MKAVKMLRGLDGRCQRNSPIYQWCESIGIKPEYQPDDPHWYLVPGWVSQIYTMKYPKSPDTAIGKAILADSYLLDAIDALIAAGLKSEEIYAWLKEVTA